MRVNHDGARLLHSVLCGLFLAPAQVDILPGVDPYSPINGISIERYADLGAELDGITDPQAQAAKVGTLGVGAADWEAAKDGWTARMMDASLMGQVATRYIALYNAALAAKKGVASTSFDDWVYVSAAIQAFGFEGALAHHGISMGDWTTISAHWQVELSKDPMNLAVRKNQMQEQEAARLKGGGQPRTITVQHSAKGAAPAGGAAAFDPHAAQAAMLQGAEANKQAWVAHSAAALQDPGIQRAVRLAGAMNSAGGGSPFVMGRTVMVQWSDGNRYSATVMQVAEGQSQVAFPDGRTMWVPNQYLTPS